MISTVPMKTLRAFADHGDVGASLGRDATNAQRLLGELAETDIDLAAITDELERRGVDSFRDSYRELLACIEAKTTEVRADARESVDA